MIWPWTAFLWVYFGICLTALLILTVAIACLIDAGTNNRFKVVKAVKFIPFVRTILERQSMGTDGRGWT